MDGYRACTLIFIYIIASSKECSGQTTIDIQPFPTATVIEEGSLTFTCIYRNSIGYCHSEALFAWFLNGKQDLLLGWRNNSCFYGEGNAALNYTCATAQDMCEITLTLTLTKVNESQHGDVWECRIENMRIKSRLVVNVPITSVDVTSPSTSPVTVSENSHITFVCETSAGRPQSTIRWFKQLGTNADVPVPGGIITTTPSGTLAITKSTLQYRPARGDHNYRVYCTAYNIDASSTYTSTNKQQLYVQYAPDNGPVLEDHNVGRTFFIMDRKHQSLTCSVEGGRPLASLSWNCFNGAVQNKTSENTTKQQVTWIAARAHAGQRCTCQANHIFWTNTKQVYVTVDVLYPPASPTFTVQSQPVSSTVSVIEGSSVSVTCNSTSNPPSVYSWNPRGSSPNSDILTLTSVNTNTSGVYTCTVTNNMIPTQGDPESQTNSAPITFNLLFPPRTPVLRYNTTNGPLVSSALFNVVRGNSFSIFCNAEGNPDPSYQWISQSANTSQMTVTSIKTDTSWTCTATNEMVPTGAPKQTGSSTATATANVLYSASITEFTINGVKGDGPFIYNENTTVTIACMVDSNPGSEITISKDGSVTVNVTNRTDTNYTIEEASCLDAGMYYCSAQNQYNDKSNSTICMQMHVRCSPRPLDSVNNNTYYYALNETATLNLTVTAYPEPTFRWYKQSVEITSGVSNITMGVSKNSHQTNLTLERLTQNDLGQYKVVVINNQGTLEHLFCVAGTYPNITTTPMGENSHDVYADTEMAPAEDGESESSTAIIAIIAEAAGGSAGALIAIGIVLLVIRRYKFSKGLPRCMLSKSETELQQRNEINSNHVYCNTTANHEAMEQKDNNGRNMYEDLKMSHLQPQLYEQLQQGEDETLDLDSGKRKKCFMDAMRD